MILTLVVDPPAIAFTIPYINYPIAWYGVLFAIGFWLAVKVFSALCDRYPFSSFTGEEISNKMMNYMIFGIILGARLFHLLFYESIEWIYRDPFALFRFWEGGLASHGGMLGAYLLGVLFANRWSLPLLPLSDHGFCAAMILGAWIRIGNFMNQEILGLPTSLPWGVIFSKPSSLLSFDLFPRHPVQIYEAVYYLFLAALGLYLLGKRKRSGFVSASLLLLFAIGRFGLEFLKEEQSIYTVGFPLTMGQILSLPLFFIAFAAFYFTKPALDCSGESIRGHEGK